MMNNQLCEEKLHSENFRPVYLLQLLQSIRNFANSCTINHSENPNKQTIDQQTSLFHTITFTSIISKAAEVELVVLHEMPRLRRQWHTTAAHHQSKQFVPLVH